MSKKINIKFNGNELETEGFYSSEHGTVANVKNLIEEILDGYEVVGKGDYIEIKAKEPVRKIGKTIFVDAGHGGTNPGASGHGIVEKNKALSVSLELSKQLVDNGFDVLMTREDDSTVNLRERSRMANNAGADYFISVHLNAFNGSVGGYETFIFNGNVDANTKSYAQVIHNHLSDLFSKKGINDRGLKEANFSVLRNTQMSASLVELGFIDSPRDIDFIKSRNYEKECAKAITAALLEIYA